MRYIIFGNRFSVDVAIAGDDEGILRFSSVQILTVVVQLPGIN